MKTDDDQKSTKDLIFESAVELFAVKGYHGTSIRDIARATGIKESSIYNHFSGKSVIMDSIIAYYHNGFLSSLPLRDEMDETSQKYTDPVELWIAGILDFMKRMPPLMDRITFIIHNEMYLDERCRTYALQTMFTLQKDMTEMLLRDLYDKGMIRECDIRKEAEQYVYMVHGVTIENRLLALSGFQNDSIAENLVAQLRVFMERLRKND